MDRIRSGNTRSWILSIVLLLNLNCEAHPLDGCAVYLNRLTPEGRAAGTRLLPSHADQAILQAGLSDDLVRWYGANRIARAVVQNIAARSKPSLIPDEQSRGRIIFDKIQAEPILVRFDAADVDSIAAHGFLNQFQVAKTRGDFAPGRRNDLASQMAGVRFPDVSVSSTRGQPTLDLSRPLDRLRPKFGMVLPNRLLSRAKSENGRELAPADGLELRVSGRRYGDFIMVMKPQVKERATFTFGDSSREVGDLENQIYTYFDSPHGDPISHRLPVRASYIEVQIWGDVGVQDVAEIWVPRGTSSRTIDRLRGFKIPIYEYENEKMVSPDRIGSYYRRLERVDGVETMESADGLTFPSGFSLRQRAHFSTPFVDTGN